MGLKMKQIDFQFKGDDYCCGIYHVGDFYERGVNFFDPNRTIHSVFSSEVFEEEMMTRLANETRDNYSKAKCGYILQASFVLKYSYKGGGEQLPKLRKYMENSGWGLVTKFKNSNTGNTVGIYQRYIEQGELNMYQSYIEEKEDFNEK